MGESQVFYPYRPLQMQAIRASISEPRFATYLKKGGGHQEYAFALYLYNARVAKAFWFPLGVAEVTLRNAIDGVLVGKFGAEWHLAADFRNRVLTPDGLATLDKAIERAGRNAPRSQVVATLTFDFWSNLFRPEYGDLWRTSLNICFPNIDKNTKRLNIQQLVKLINKFRNRVAHHEPILDMNVNDIYSKILDLMSLRCVETAKWVKHYTTLSSVLRSRPRKDGSSWRFLSSRLDADVQFVSASTPLADILKNFDERHPVVICTDDHGIPLAALNGPDIIKYIASQCKNDDGLIDINEHSVSDVIKKYDLVNRWVTVNESSPFDDTIEILKERQVQIIVGISAPSGKATGAIARAHRRY